MMLQLRKKLVFFLLLIGSALASQAQPFKAEIDRFKNVDSLQAPPKNAILFIGSSSFNFWKNLPGWFPDYPVINRGFGGSSLPHVDMYADKIIFPYKPAQIVMYCGENDLAVAGVTADTVIVRFTNLFNKIRKEIPGVPFAYVSIKPSPSREHLMPEMVKSNEAIRRFLLTQPNTAFIDVYSKMLLPDGKPMPDIFVGDRLHMNEKGYKIWKAAIEPVLLKL